MTTGRSRPRLAAARPGAARPRWPGLLLAVALLSPAVAAGAPDPPVPLAPAKDWSREPLPSTPPAPAAIPGQPRIHAGWYFELGFALGGAVAGVPGGTASLADLAGGNASTPWGIDLRGGYTLRPELRLGLVVAMLMTEGSQAGLSTSATVGRVGGELSWHPRGDGPFLRGELGLGFLEVMGVEGSPTGSWNSDVTFTGPALTLGGGWLFGWHHLGVAHLLLGADLSWAHYSGSEGAAVQPESSLSWALRVGVDCW